MKSTNGPTIDMRFVGTTWVGSTLVKEFKRSLKNKMERIGADVGPVRFSGYGQRADG